MLCWFSSSFLLWIFFFCIICWVFTINRSKTKKKDKHQNKLLNLGWAYFAKPFSRGKTKKKKREFYLYFWFCALRLYVSKSLFFKFFFLFILRFHANWILLTCQMGKWSRGTTKAGKNKKVWNQCNYFVGSNFSFFFDYDKLN